MVFSIKLVIPHLIQNFARFGKTICWNSFKNSQCSIF